jgi:hypothetical protein
LQDQITARLARSLAIELFQAESRRMEADRSKNLDSMDFTMRGKAMMLGDGRKPTRLAKIYLTGAATRSDNVEAMIGKAGWRPAELRRVCIRD